MSLKSVDQLIDKFGVSAFASDTPFLKRKVLTSSNACDVGMPFCFYQKLSALKCNQTVWCFTAYLPSKNKRLALFLVDENNKVIEQVYFPRDRKSVMSCQKIQKLLQRSLLSANSDSYVLAA